MTNLDMIPLILGAFFIGLGIGIKLGSDLYHKHLVKNGVLLSKSRVEELKKNLDSIGMKLH